MSCTFSLHSLPLSLSLSLSHALADKSAELQRQTTRTAAVEEELAETRSTLAMLQERLQSKSEACTRARQNLGSTATLFSEFRSTFNQALTRLVNYERRVVFAVKRMQSLRGERIT